MERAAKYNNGKPQLDLLPAEPLRQIARALEFGCQKYDKHNWRKGMPWTEAYAAACRHLLDFIEGEDFNPESGLPHVAHAGANILFLLQYMVDRVEWDDRYKGEQNDGN